MQPSTPTADPEEAHELEVAEMLERALLRSFDDTGAGEEVFNVDTGEVERFAARSAAVKRVQMLTDRPDKAFSLTSLFLKKRKRNGQAVDSPAVNTMLDSFTSGGSSS